METRATRPTMSVSPCTWILLVFLGLVGAVYVLVATSQYGIGYAGDSGGYFGPARAILGEEPFFQSRHSVMWPPVYAAFLALSGLLLRMEPLGAARFLNAGIFFAIILVTGAWVLRRLKSPPVALTCSLCLLFSYPLLVMAKMGLSDTLFVLLLVLFLIACERYFEKGRIRDLVLAGLVAALSTLTRYAGVTLVLSGGLFLVFDGRIHFGRRVRAVVLFCAVALTPLLLWLIRNWVVSGTLFGNRYPSPKPFVWNLLSTVVLAGHWFVPFDVPRYPKAVLGGLCLLGAAVVVWRCIRRRCLGGESSTLVRLLLFMGVYLAYLVVSTTLVAVEQISLRYLLPAYVPALLVVLPVLWNVARSGGRTRRNVIFGAAGLWLALSLASGAELMNLSLGKGTGTYSARRWTESSLIAYLKTHPVGGELYSNYPEPIDLLTRARAKRSPRWHAGNAPQVPVNELEDLKRALGGEGSAYLAWFEGMDNISLVPLDRLAAELRLEEIAFAADGALYRVSAGALGGAEPEGIANRK